MQDITGGFINLVEQEADDDFGGFIKLVLELEIKDEKCSIYL